LADSFSTNHPAIRVLRVIITTVIFIAAVVQRIWQDSCAPGTSEFRRGLFFRVRQASSVRAALLKVVA
jgi:hypothetical protein